MYRMIIILNGVVLSSFALYRAVKIYKESQGLTGLDLVRILVRDQILYSLA